MHLADNKVVIVPSPIYNRNTKTWSCGPFNCYGTAHKVHIYSPIYILLSKYGYMLFIMHRFACTVNTTTNAIKIK